MDEVVAKLVPDDVLTKVGRLLNITVWSNLILTPSSI